jgi:superfamily II DNA/RNA helicase
MACFKSQTRQDRKVLIFGNRRDRTQRLATKLHQHGIDCELLSGAVRQEKRLKILNDFRDGRVKVVVAPCPTTTCSSPRRGTGEAGSGFSL